MFGVALVVFAATTGAAVLAVAGIAAVVVAVVAVVAVGATALAAVCGSAGSTPPFFFAPGPQIAAAITPAVARKAASVSGQRAFFFCSLKVLSSLKQSIAQPIGQFFNCVNFVNDWLNWVIQSIKVRALRGHHFLRLRIFGLDGFNLHIQYDI